MYNILVPGSVDVVPPSATSNLTHINFWEFFDITGATLTNLLNWTRCGAAWETEKSPFYVFERDSGVTNDYECPSDFTMSPTPARAYDDYEDYSEKDDEFCPGVTLCNSVCLTNDECHEFYDQSCQEYLQSRCGDGVCDTVLDCDSFGNDCGDCESKGPSGPPQSSDDDSGGSNTDDYSGGSNTDNYSGGSNADDDGGRRLQNNDGYNSYYDGDQPQGGPNDSGSQDGGNIQSWIDQENIDSNCQCDYTEPHTEGCCKDECNNRECYYSWGNCADTMHMFWECAPDCPALLLGDGVCHEACNTIGCQLDGGDCCFPESTQQTFSLHRFTEGYAEVLPDETIPLERYIGRRNRLVAGILITQTRMEEGMCGRDEGMSAKWNLKKHFDSELLKRYIPGSGSEGIKHGNLYETCVLPNESVQAFGVDPVFLPAAGLYNRELFPSDFYDIDVAGGGTDQVNSGGLPIAFKYFGIGGSNFDGFQAFLDINFRNARAKEVFDYLLQGFYFDERTSSVKVSFVTLNGHTSSFCLNSVEFGFGDSGAISMEYSINAFPAEPYSSSDDFLRLCLELTFVVLTFVNIGTELSEIFVSKIQTGR